ncbi:MAG: hypothetical protein QM770_05170 [Tepidisphaeraceae bacterium]
MARTQSDSFDEDPSDEQEWDESDVDESVDTFPCPYCKTEVYEHADICPACGSFVAFPASSSRPKWILVTAILLIAVMGGAVGIFSWFMR